MNIYSRIRVYHYRRLYLAKTTVFLPLLAKYKSIVMEQLIGRQEEIAILQRVLASNEAELIAVYGRRRVGKTFLIKTFFKKQLFIDFSGVHDATLKESLSYFGKSQKR